MAGKKQQKRVKVQVSEGADGPKNSFESLESVVFFSVEASGGPITARDRKEIEEAIKATLSKQGHEVVRPNAKLNTEAAAS